MKSLKIQRWAGFFFCSVRQSICSTKYIRIPIVVARSVSSTVYNVWCGNSQDTKKLFFYSFCSFGFGGVQWGNTGCHASVCERTTCVCCGSISIAIINGYVVFTLTKVPWTNGKTTLQGQCSTPPTLLHKIYWQHVDSLTSFANYWAQRRHQRLLLLLWNSHRYTVNTNTLIKSLIISGCVAFQTPKCV